MNELNVRNRTIFHGDNLEFLRGINSETIHLIATDPPFKKGRDFHATPGSLAQGASFKDRWSWEQDVQGDWVDKIKDDWPAAYAVIESTRLSYGEDMSAFLCWLGVRLMEMHRVLRADGSLYLHIDHTAHAYVKALLDSIFGARSFRNEIVWRRIRGAKNDARQYGRSSDTILFYTKSQKWTFDPPRLKQVDDSWYKKEDERGKYVSRPLLASGATKGDSGQVWRGVAPKGHWIVPRLLTARYEKEQNRKLQGTVRERLDILADAGYIDFSRNGNPSWRRYLFEANPPRVDNIWDDEETKLMSRNSPERVGYPTQKPLALYERIIKASSNEGDFVLDPFCGCATTPIAAERLKRQWIGMDIWDGALEQVQNRLVRDTILRFDDQQHHVTLPKVHYETKAPIRTDDNEIAAPRIKHKIPIPKEKWEMLSHKQMKSHLAQYQTRDESKNLVACAGCGRELEVEFMELDHISPKSDGGANSIINRILICRPCNGRKSNGLTLTGLHRENRREKWMQSKELADFAKLRQSEAVDHAKRDPDSIQV